MGKNYPSREEAEVCIEWFKSVDGVMWGADDISDGLKKAFEKSEHIRQTEWRRVFGDDSPWRCGGDIGSPKLIWDDDKARRLGVQE